MTDKEAEQQEENIGQTHQLQDRLAVRKPVCFENFVISATMKNAYFEPNTYIHGGNHVKTICTGKKQWQ